MRNEVTTKGLYPAIDKLLSREHDPRPITIFPDLSIVNTLGERRLHFMYDLYVLGGGDEVLARQDLFMTEPCRYENEAQGC